LRPTARPGFQVVRVDADLACMDGPRSDRLLAIIKTQTEIDARWSCSQT
jgi:hypothetical protein